MSKKRAVKNEKLFCGIKVFEIEMSWDLVLLVGRWSGRMDGWMRDYGRDDESWDVESELSLEASESDRFLS